MKGNTHLLTVSRFGNCKVPALAEKQTHTQLYRMEGISANYYKILYLKHNHSYSEYIVDLKLNVHLISSFKSKLFLSQILSITFIFPILLEKEPVFSLLNVQC